MKKTLIAVSIAATLTTSFAFAANDWKAKTKDAWIDGKAEATLLFNGNLNSFDIETDVQNGTVILTGKVDSDVDKKLAEELVEGIEGVSSVNNKLDVDNDSVISKESKREIVDRKIAVVLTSRILFDTDLSAFDIDVDVKNGKVTLNGRVKSDSEKDLAEQIAHNTDDVESVINNLKISRNS
ncbi:BON domain-containing protein [Aliikangiella maris]|uniref:BON domain-containing protein n=2 Tax=Aliikangiella maris TaxID=3162458 RepID=A0ABV2BV79_9GAMM